MCSGYGDVGDSDLALVTSSESNRSFFLRADKVEISFLELLSSFVFFSDTLEDNVVLIGFLEGKHLEGGWILCELDCFWEQGFAYLTLEL